MAAFPNGQPEAFDYDFSTRVAIPDLGQVGILAEGDNGEDLSEDEGLEDYKKGGYHPVYVGEILNDRYVIL